MQCFKDLDNCRLPTPAQVTKPPTFVTKNRVARFGTKRPCQSWRAIVAAVLFAATPAAAEKPNIVLFISDDHGYLDSEVAGNRDVHTPNMLRLARAGMTFTHAFAVSPSCAPSRAALLTGLYPLRNGSMINHQPPAADVKKLPAYMQELGYEVVAFGKVAHYKQTAMYGFDKFAHDTFHDHECIPAALKFLRERQSAKPLCLLVGTNWPHVPWPKADPSDEELANMKLPPTHVDTPETRAWRQRYYAAVEKMDADLGQVYDAAYEKLDDDTLFIHFSDHGAQWPFGKWNLYDAGTRVPFFAVWPGVIQPKVRTDAMISLIDVLPTIIEAAGGQPPADIDGRSRLSVLLGSDPAGAEHIFTTHSGDGRMNEFPIRSVRGRDWKYIFNLRPDAEHHTHIDRGETVDGNRYWLSWIEKAKADAAAKAIVDRYFHRPTEEFYDLGTDPYETKNLIDPTVPNPTLETARKALHEITEQLGDQGLLTEAAFAEALERQTKATNK
jgi:N-sulfoglucosamine sulfohydrolase